MSTSGVIVSSVMFAGGVTIARDAMHGHLVLVRVGLGMAAAGIGLSLLGQLSPDIAKGFAVILALGAALKAGPDVFNFIGIKLGGPPVKPNPVKQV